VSSFFSLMKSANFVLMSRSSPNPDTGTNLPGRL
jgi:hypothetical protein